MSTAANWSSFSCSEGDVKFTESKNGNKSEEGEAYYTNFIQEDVLEIRKVAEETGQPSMALMHMEASIHAGNWQWLYLSRRWTLSAWEKTPVSILYCVLGSSNPCGLTFFSPTLQYLALPFGTFWFLSGLLAPVSRPYCLTKNLQYR